LAQTIEQKTHPVTEQVAALVEPVVDEMGVELVDVEYLSENGRWILRIYVDKPGGVTLDDCVRVSREIDDLIEVKDIFHQEYVLEVSSPGLNRRLKKERDFERVVGKTIRVRMITPIRGRRNFKGILHSFENGILRLRVEDDSFLLPYRDLDRANLVYEFKQS